MFVVNMGLGVNSRTMCSVADLSVSASARVVAHRVAGVAHSVAGVGHLRKGRSGSYCCAIVGRVSTVASTNAVAVLLQYCCKYKRWYLLRYALRYLLRYDGMRFRMRHESLLINRSLAHGI